MAFQLPLTAGAAPYVIAEIGGNFEGDLARARRMIRLAAAAGARGVKFQVWDPATFVALPDRLTMPRLERLALDIPALRALREEAVGAGVDFLCSVFSPGLVAPLAELCPALKIASGDVSCEEIVRRAAATGRPVILSTGAATLEEIDRAVGWVADEGSGPLEERLAILHCVSAYPCPQDEANLLAIRTLQEHCHPLTVGWSCHVPGLAAPLTATALGARIIEVHVTCERNEFDFHDHTLALEFDELALLCRSCGQWSGLAGSGRKEVMPAERPVLARMRRSLAWAGTLAAGHVVGPDDLCALRPGTGIPAENRHLVVGRTLCRSVQAGVLVAEADLTAGEEGIPAV